jgi:hypothetical protein
VREKLEIKGSKEKPEAVNHFKIKNISLLFVDSELGRFGCSGRE